MSKDISVSRKKLRAEKDLIDWESVGRRIRQLRGFDMTQEELAARIGVSQGHLSYMERGEKEIGAEILLRISRQFGKPLEWLLVGNDS
jgi:transcriptional regulator with XRE-family HTH domain